VLVEQWLENPQPQQYFLPPNQLFEVRGDVAVILQVTPTSPGRARIRRFDFTGDKNRGNRGAREGSRREMDAWLAAQVALAESTQSGFLGAGADAADSGPVSPALAQFRDSITPLLQALAK
jgi:hypothetical protein